MDSQGTRTLTGRVTLETFGINTVSQIKASEIALKQAKP